MNVARPAPTASPRKQRLVKSIVGGGMLLGMMVGSPSPSDAQTQAGAKLPVSARVPKNLGCGFVGIREAGRKRRAGRTLRG